MKILLGLSGGVDSTYAALKLKNEGHEVHGAVVIMHAYTDAIGAERAAEEVGIPIHTIDAANEFENSVCRNFVSEYTAGRTPNPCVLCNREVKFKCLCDYAIAHGFDAIATGHYARVLSYECEAGTRYYVAMARDTKKDQSYMLSRLSQQTLSMLMLPMGEELKSDITDVAREIGLSAAQKEESQEICFIPDGKYTEYIETRAGASAHGSFVDASGNILGEHKGIIRYTVGQRKGLEIALGKRVFVTEIDPLKNTVTLEDIPRLSDTVHVEDLVFSKIAPQADECSYNLRVKLRYLARPAECDVRVTGARATVYLSEPQPSVTPGQAAVFYDGDDCVMAGIITGVERKSNK